ALALPGWFAFRVLRVPAAPLLGSMVSVAVIGSFGIRPVSLPAYLRLSCQIVIGLFTGLRVTKGLSLALKKMAVPSVIVSIWWLVVSLATGHLLYRVTTLDITTALLSSTPGGIAEMSLLAMSLGGEPAIVAILQFFRLSSVLLVTPVVGPWIQRLTRKDNCTEDQWKRTAESEDCAYEGAGSRCGKLSPYLRSVGLAVLGGAVFNAAGLPAGGLIGSMLAVGTVRAMGRECATIPKIVKSLAQAGLGALIGAGLTSSMLKALAAAYVPLILLTLIMLANGFLLAVLVQRLTGWDLQTCILSCCAGGLSQMSVVAEDLGAEPVTVTFLHLARWMTVVVLLPWAYRWILS
ncbi:MAG TPA: AbrB family transcriptional regulator, partial [Clostridia bacterium]|nr:AbrB family transcriptional regulator [Clostridia bacterium]